MFDVYREFLQFYDRTFADPDALRLSPFINELFFWLLVIALTIGTPRWNTT